MTIMIYLSPHLNIYSQFPHTPQLGGVGEFLIPSHRNLSVHSPLLCIKPLHRQDHGVAHHKVRVLVVVNIVAHTNGAIGEIAKHTATILSDNSCLPAAAYRVAKLCPIKVKRGTE